MIAAAVRGRKNNPKEALVTGVFVRRRGRPTATLNVNMDKHPHRINERRMDSLNQEGGEHAASTLPHLTHE